MNRPPLVSVCVPTFNRAHYLPQCLESILGQTFGDFELIVQDNASTDETPNVVTQCRDPRVRYYRNDRNLGQIPNINCGIAHATGDYVSVCHDDDVYASTMLQRQVDTLARYPRVGLVHTAVWLMTETGALRGVHRVSQEDYVRRGREAFLRYLAFGHDIVFTTAMVRRACYEQAGSFHPAYLCADFDMWLRLALHCDVAYLAEPLAGYRVHAANATSGMTAVRWFAEYFEIFDRAVAIAAEKSLEISIPVERLRAQACQYQARRSRIEAAACIAVGNYTAAAEYVTAASRMDPSLMGSLRDNLLRLGCNQVGCFMLGGVRGLRRRLKVWPLSGLTRAQSDLSGIEGRQP